MPSDAAGQRLIAPGWTAVSGKDVRNYQRNYWGFVIPGALVIAAVIVFPWIFTIYTSTLEYEPGTEPSFIGLRNFTTLFADPEFGMALVRTLYFTVLGVMAPLILGVLAALCFKQNFVFRGIARAIFVLPMMATPVAIALVWTIMFNPQFGVLNYLLTSVGLPASLWVYSADTVIPTLAMVETWQWTPLVMLIVLGGLASLPAEPYEAASLDGASHWQMFRHITFPLIWPFITVAAILRCIEAIKSFDLIYVITQGGPGSASETLNIFLYQTAFVNYHIGYASATALVFFVLVVAICLIWLSLRRVTA
jgi:multiple sugar transport system permease protein